MPFHSQLGQDRWVAGLHGGLPGYFVDVGAYDGIRISNTFHLEKGLGWSGICIEPNPRAFANLKSIRTCICENLCVAPSRGMVKFRCSSTWSMIVPGDGKNTVDVMAEPLADILGRNGAPREIGYLSLDIEGTELEVLESFPFDRYSFAAMTVEHNAHLGPGWLARRDRMRALLVGKGYRLAREAGQDDWWVLPGLQEHLI